jgi:putative ABC transport system ATP-binding protein
VTLKIEHLKFSYDLQEILSIDQLDIKKDEKVFLFGNSGSGKTTLLSLIAGILKTKSGSIKLMGREISSIPTGKIDSFRGENIGFIFQSFNLIPYLTVKENILLPASLKKKETEFSARAEKLAHDLGLKNYLNQKASSLSVGQQQRVAAARALLLEPPVIIADEPTSSLDSDNSHEFMNLLLQQWNKKPFTLLFVSHDQRLKTFFDRSLDLLELNKASNK